MKLALHLREHFDGEVICHFKKDLRHYDRSNLMLIYLDNTQARIDMIAGVNQNIGIRTVKNNKTKVRSYEVNR